MNKDTDTFLTAVCFHHYQVKAVVSIGASDIITMADKTYGDEVFPSLE